MGSVNPAVVGAIIPNLGQAWLEEGPSILDKDNLGVKLNTNINMPLMVLLEIIDPNHALGKACPLVDVRTIWKGGGVGPKLT